jgi:hypothetical protein
LQKALCCSSHPIPVRNSSKLMVTWVMTNVMRERGLHAPRHRSSESVWNSSMLTECGRRGMAAHGGVGRLAKTGHDLLVRAN